MKSVTTFSQEVYKNGFGTSAVRSSYIFWIKKQNHFFNFFHGIYRDGKKVKIAATVEQLNLCLFYEYHT